MHFRLLQALERLYGSIVTKFWSHFSKQSWPHQLTVFCLQRGATKNTKDLATMTSSSNVFNIPHLHHNRVAKRHHHHHQQQQEAKAEQKKMRTRDGEVVVAAAEPTDPTIVSQQQQQQQQVNNMATSELATLFVDFMEFGSVGLHIVDNNGIILWANQAELDLLGYTKEEYFGHPLSNFHLDPNKLDYMLTTLFSGNKVKNFVVPIRAKDGHVEYLEVNSSMRQVNGEYVTTRCFSTCVTDRVLRQQENLEAIARQKREDVIQEEDKRKTEFLRQLCHELRNPLAGILGNLDLLLSELHEYVATTACEACATTAPPTPTPQAAPDRFIKLIQSSLSYAESAKMAAEHQKFVIDDTLSLARLESNSNNVFEFVPQPVDLSQEIKTVQAIFGVTAQAKKIYVKYALNDEIRFIKTDPVWVKQIAMNLLSNSLKFTGPEGQVEVKLARSHRQCISSVSSRSSSSQNRTTMVELTVRDTGIGMTDDEQRTLFNPVKHSNEMISAKFGGSGLGLHIVKQLLDRVNGTIDIKSQKGVGTTIVCAIPYEPLQPNEKATLTSEAITPMVVPTITTPSLPMNDPLLARKGQHKNVLIVDDCFTNRKILSRFLHKKGYNYQVAENGQIALDLHDKTPFDIILTDVDMPVMDGHEMTRNLRKKENCIRKLNGEKTDGDVSSSTSTPSSCSYNPVPIIGISGNALPEDVQRAKQIGMNEYISKPYKFPELEALISKYI